MRLRLKSTRHRLVYTGMGLLLAGLGLLLYGPAFDILNVNEINPFGASTIQDEVVRRVIDGDTIELNNGMRVRYIGVDTPELRTRRDGRWTYRPQRLAEEAYAFNQRLVEGRKIRLEYDQERTDRYQRDLAYVFVGDLFVNAELVRSGYARVLVHPPNLKYSSLFLKLQQEAKNQQKGLWASGRKRWLANLSVESRAGSGPSSQPALPRRQAGGRQVPPHPSPPQAEPDAGLARSSLSQPVGAVQ